MATPPSTSSTYEWDTDPAVPTSGGGELPSDLPREIDGAQPSSGRHPIIGARPWTTPKPSRGLPAWAIVAIVALVLVSLLTGLGILVAGLVVRAADSAGYSDVWVVDEGGTGFTDGVVTDTAGDELTDGTGSYALPAVVGEHTFTWPTLDGGTISVHATGIELDAAVPLAKGEDVIQQGYQLVVLDAEVSYRGERAVAVPEELWIRAETDHALYEPILGLVPNPLTEAGTLSNRESLVITVAVLVPEEDLDELVISVETPEGMPLYYRAG